MCVCVCVYVCLFVCMFVHNKHKSYLHRSKRISRYFYVTAGNVDAFNDEQSSTAERDAWSKVWEMSQNHDVFADFVRPQQCAGRKATG